MATSTVNLDRLADEIVSGLSVPPATAPAPVRRGHPLADPESQEFRGLAQQYGLDPGFMGKLMHAESARDPQAVSKKGAQGLFQLMPALQQDYGVTDPFDPTQNVPAGMQYMRDLLKQYGGNQTKALAAWSAGPGAVQKYGGVPPFEETKGLIRKVTGEDALNPQLLDRQADEFVRSLGLAPMAAPVPPRAAQPTPTQRRYIPGEVPEPYPVTPVVPGAVPAGLPQRPATLPAGRQGTADTNTRAARPR